MKRVNLILENVLDSVRPAKTNPRRTLGKPPKALAADGPERKLRVRKQKPEASDLMDAAYLEGLREGREQGYADGHRDGFLSSSASFTNNPKSVLRRPDNAIIGPEYGTRPVSDESHGVSFSYRVSMEVHRDGRSRQHEYGFTILRTTELGSMHAFTAYSVDPDMLCIARDPSGSLWKNIANGVFGELRRYGDPTFIAKSIATCLAQGDPCIEYIVLVELTQRIGGNDLDALLDATPDPPPSR